MPTFRQIAAPLLVASVLGAGLTGVLSAQTKPNARVAGQVTEAGAIPADQKQAAEEAFVAGVHAYQSGDLDEATRHWESAASAGHLGAQWNLARVFTGASGGKADPRRRLHYLQLAAAQHNPDAAPGPRLAVTLEALIELARAYRAGVPEASLPAQPTRALGIFEHAASLFGHPRAQHYLGLMYLRGDGVSPDMSRAVRWLFLAARKQYAPSQAALGEFFLKRAVAREGTDAREGASDDRMRGLVWIALAGRNAQGETAQSLFRERYEEAIVALDDAERERVRTLVDGWSAGQKSAALELAK